MYQFKNISLLSKYHQNPLFVKGFGVSTRYVIPNGTNVAFYGLGILNVIEMSVNQFNICPSCVHCKTCVLTSQKDKVWSCSEYEEEALEPSFSLANRIDKNRSKKSLMTLA
ncbi:hypothetical protein [Algibacter sp. L3A6]|uniref:hypothetical protein n=1 Tax=Algibacter sp. L3A6 TaxID=2686366 RepID=UPI00131AB3A5|nr:hypothetical protein [Algibacter sp. L3A6]